MEYSGELISGKKAKENESIYSRRKQGNFLFFLKHLDKLFCIDATKESPRLGRLINHSKCEANIKPKMIIYEDNPRIVFFSTKIIEQGEELLFSYEDTRIAKNLTMPKPENCFKNPTMQ